MCLDCLQQKPDFAKEIEERLRKEKKIARKEVKLLLLGTGESGKSTFMKQMRIIHDRGFTATELAAQRKYVFHNTIACMQTILGQMAIRGIAFESARGAAFAEFLLATEVTYENAAHLFGGNDYLPAEYGEAISGLWKDEGVRQCYAKRTDYKLSDSAEYFFTNVDRFTQNSFVPNDQDILRIRLPTTGIVEHCFRFKKILLRIVDVGGQQSERRKWINCFDCVKSIIFLTALNEYDMYFDHDHQHHNKTRMHESLDLFKIITNIEALSRASFILFLNKKDLFEEKISDSPLKQCFPEYDGPNQSTEAREFIRNLFVQHAFGDAETFAGTAPATKNASESQSRSISDAYAHGGNRIRRPLEQKPIYAHFTNATDTNNIKIVFDSVKFTILQENIEVIFPDTKF